MKLSSKTPGGQSLSKVRYPYPLRITWLHISRSLVFVILLRPRTTISTTFGKFLQGVNTKDVLTSYQATLDPR